MDPDDACSTVPSTPSLTAEALGQPSPLTFTFNSQVLKNRSVDLHRLVHVLFLHAFAASLDSIVAGVGPDAIDQMGNDIKMPGGIIMYDSAQGVVTRTRASVTGPMWPVFVNGVTGAFDNANLCWCRSSSWNDALFHCMYEILGVSTPRSWVFPCVVPQAELLCI